MPTTRTIMFLLTALVLYIFANQTQLGWLYVMSALLLGTVVASAWLGRGALRSIAAERRIHAGSSGEVSECDQLTIHLRLHDRRRVAASQITVIERCPLVEPNSSLHHTQFFVPSLNVGHTVELAYEITVYRRGLHEFPPLILMTRAPFGFFRRQRSISLPTRLLVYPEVRPLRRLPMLDHRPAPQASQNRIGYGGDVIGIRPFRSGDSPRIVHWRTTARTQQLMSKEFAAEAHPSMTLVLDLYRHPYPEAGSKYTSFEWQIKLAASIGDYANRRGYALQLGVDRDAWPLPPGPLSWPALLQYLARIEPTGAQALVNVLQQQPGQNSVVAILPWPDERMVEPLVAMAQRGQQVLAIVLNPESFPHGGPSGEVIGNRLRASGIERRMIQFEDDWREVLEQRD